VQLGMSAVGHKQTHAPQQTDPYSITSSVSNEYLTEIGPQTVEAGTGPKNIRSTFSFPITRASSCIVQYMRISTSRMI
jgi:hypothetical protein